MRRIAPLSAVLLLATLAAVPALSAAGTPRAWGRIVIPSIGLNTPFYNGQGAVDTDDGPSHYPWTGMPGGGRTIGIAGHRVTHTHPFLRLGELRMGDKIQVDYGKRFAEHACYHVTGTLVVSPSAVWVTRDVGVERLVLTTCTPPHSARYRLVVFARRSMSCT